jgi:hypothetical protein
MILKKPVNIQPGASAIVAAGHGGVGICGKVF